jgi:hypothetical protein
MSTNAAHTWASVERKAAISLFIPLADFGFELFLGDGKSKEHGNLASGKPLRPHL